MSFFKSFCLAVLATLFLTYALGMSLIEMLDVDVYVGQTFIEPLQAISVSALVVVLIVLAAMAIVLSVFGSAIFIGALVFGAIAMVVVGIFWPVLLIAFIIYLLVREKPVKQYS